MRLTEGKQLRGDLSQMVWKVNMKSQIRTMGEIKDSMFKAIALVCIVVGSVTTQFRALDGLSWGMPNGLFTVTAQ